MNNVISEFDLVLKGATVVLPHPTRSRLTEAVVEIAVRNGKIVEVADRVRGVAARTLDLTGLHVLPGVVDSQVHFREPGLTHKEDLESGTRGALLGGVTTVFEMPNTNPTTTTVDAFNDKLRRAQNRCHTNYAFYIGGSPENASQLGQLERLPHCPGIKIFMGSSTGTLLIEDDATLEKVLTNGNRRVIVHSEDEARLRERKPLAEAAGNVRFHPQWRDEETAFRATRRLLTAARKTGRPVHVLHVTSGGEMDFLQTQKDIATVEVLPQHLTLSAPECYDRLGTLAQMNPPIREVYHRERLWRAVLDGTVDVLGSDHAPHTLAEKAKPYPQSPGGFPGVQTIITIMLNHVNQGRLPLTRFVELMGEGPRRVFGLRHKGRIEVGADADFTVIDMKKTRTIKNSWIASKVKWTPFDGMTTQGWAVMAIMAGEIAMREDEILLPHRGQPVVFT